MDRTDHSRRSEQPADPEGLYSDLAGSLARAIRADDRIARLGSEGIPRPERVRGLYNMLLDLTYPGYFGWEVTPTDLGPKTYERVLHLREILTEQIAMATGPGQDRFCRDVATTFLRQIAGIRRAISLDVQAAQDGDPACHSPAEAILCMPGVRAVTVHRYAHALVVLGVPLLARMLSAFAREQTNIDIHPGARIGRSFFIDHGGGVVIGETAQIGDHCKIYQGVTLGARSFPKDELGRILREPKRHPTLEDHVTVYANATILGGSTVVGAGSVVGAGVFVSSSIPPGRIVVGSKPEIRLLENQDRPPASFDI